MNNARLNTSPASRLPIAGLCAAAVAVLAIAWLVWITFLSDHLSERAARAEELKNQQNLREKPLVEGVRDAPGGGN